MQKLEFKIAINASPEKVWQVLFTQDYYKKWSSSMNEDTHFEGNWEEGSIMKFLDPKNNGMYNLVEKNIASKELRMKHLGWILEGELSPQGWEDSTMTYLFQPVEKGTLLIGEVNSLDEFVDFFNVNYPKNFEKIKNLAEEH